MRIVTKPTRKIAKSDTDANAFDAITDIVTFLGALGLCRDSRDNQGIIAAKNIRPRCAVLSLIWLVYTCITVRNRFKYSNWDEKVWRAETYNELIHSILLHLQLVLVVWGSATEKDDIVNRYYTDLARLDQILGNRNIEYYQRERSTLNCRFFSLTFVYLAKQIFETGLWMLSFGFLDIFSFTSDYVANFIQMISQFHYFIQISVFRNRLKSLEERLEADLKSCGDVKLDRNKDYYSEIIMKYRSCYILLHEQNKIINQRHGLKITMSIVCNITSVIRTIYKIIVFVVNKKYSWGPHWAIMAGILRTFLDLTLLLALLLYISRIRHLRERLLDMLEPLVCELTLSEREQRSVLGLVELIHRQPLRFTAYEFFTLDMPLLCSLFNFIVTYIVILTQIKNPTDVNRSLNMTN